MKIILLTVAVLVVAVHGDVSPANILGKLVRLTDKELIETEDLAASCLKKHGVEEKLVIGASNGIFPNHKGLKCYFECYNKGFGLMKPDGKLDLSKIKDQTPEPIYKLGNYCASQVEHSDHCEKAYLAYKCFVIEGQKAKKAQH